MSVAGRSVPLDARLAWRHVRSGLAAQPRPVRLWLAFLGLLLAAGAYGAIRSLPPGDAVFGTSAKVEWGILIAAYVFFAVTTSGLCLVSSLGHVFGIDAFKPLAKRAVTLAIVSLLAAFVIIGLDLHYPVRLVLGAILRPSPTSAMWWMGAVYGVYLVVLCVELTAMLTHRERLARLAGGVAVVTAVVAPSTLGAVFGVLAARPFWYGAFVPAYFLVSALLSGAALLGAVFYLVGRLRLRGHRSAGPAVVLALGRVLALVIGVAAILTAWRMIGGLGSDVPGLPEATRAQLAGPLSVGFWVFKVAIGLVVPGLILVVPWTRTPFGVFVASCLAFAGIFADRLSFVDAGQIAPAANVAGTILVPYTEYAPTIVEVAVILGAVGLVGLMYTVAERFLDLGAGHGGRRAAPVPDSSPMVGVL